MQKNIFFARLKTKADAYIRQDQFDVMAHAKPQKKHQHSAAAAASIASAMAEIKI